jgi:hypothetical protein
MTLPTSDDKFTYVIVGDTTDYIAIDAVPNAGEQSAWSVTDHPIGGRLKQEHSQAQPVNINISGIISDLPPDWSSDLPGPERQFEVRRRLESLATSTTFTVIIPGRIQRENCMLTSLSVGVTVGGHVTVDLSFKQVEFVESAVEQVTLQRRSGSGAGGRKTSDRGAGGTSGIQPGSSLYNGGNVARTTWGDLLREAQ